MKYSAVAVAAFVALASAQADVSIIPSCAIPCIDDAAAKASDCAAKDFKCICSNVDAIVPAATTCVLSACGNAVALNEVLPATEKFCKAVLAGGGSASASSSTPAKPSSSAPAAASSSAPAQESSAAPSSAPASSAASSAASSVYPTASITKSVAPSSAAPTTAKPTSTTSVITAGAANVAGSLGLLILGAVAAL